MSVTIPATGSGTATPAIGTDLVSTTHYQQVKLVDGTTGQTTGIVGATPADNLAGQFGLATFTQPSVFDGTNWDRTRSVQGVTAGANTDLGITAVGVGPGYNRLPAQQTASATGALAGISTGGGAVAYARVSGTYTGLQINFETTIDGTTWQQGSFRPGVGSNVTYGQAVFTASDLIGANNATFEVWVAGYAQVRANITGISTGTAAINWSISQAAPINNTIIASSSGASLASSNPSTDGISAVAALATYDQLMLYNSASFDRMRSHKGANAFVPTQDMVGILATTAWDGETSHSALVTPNRFAAVGKQQTILNDSFDTGITANLWTTTTASGGTVTTTSGETLLQTSANATGSALITTTITPDLVAGATYVFTTQVRVGDTGLTANARRWGLYTLSGTTPQDGYYFELSGTTFNYVSAKAGTPTATASGAGNRDGGFTIDTNYHRYDIYVFGDLVYFIVDGIARHVLSNVGVATTRTATLTLPITYQDTNSTSTATNEVLAVRLGALVKVGDDEQSLDQLTIVPNSRTGITASGIGPGYDIKVNPTGILTTSTANAVTYTVDGADVLSWAVTTIGTTPGSMIFEYSNDDGTTWNTHGSVLKLGSEVWIQGSFVPAVGDVYMTRATGLRQIRCRVSAVYASGNFTAKVTASTGAALTKAMDLSSAPHNFGYTQVTKTAQYTTTQTSTALWTPASGKRVVVTSVQVQVGGTTAGTLQLYFGSGAYSRGTNQAIFDGEFAPSTTLKPGVIMTPYVPYTSLTTNDSLRVTDSAAINPLTVTVWGYEVV